MYLPTIINPNRIDIAYNECAFDLMARYEDKFFDLAIPDIPYGLNVGKMAFLKEKNTSVVQKNGQRLNANKNKKHRINKNWDQEVPSQEFFDELCRISKHQIIFGVEYVDWKGLGPGRIKWNKGVAEGMSFKSYEMAYCSMIDYELEIDLLWSGMQQAKSISEPMTPQGNKKLNEKRIHPTQKPILLYDVIYQKFGFEGMKIIDTHLGSGSSRISANKFGFDFVSSEKDNDHFNDQELRYKNYKSQLELLFPT